MTFHAACGRLLRRDAERARLPSSFTIYDQADQLRLVKACIEELELDPKRFAPRAVHARHLARQGAAADGRGLRRPGRDVLRADGGERLRALRARLHDANAMDFDDLIMQAVLLLEADEEARDRLAGAVRYVMVDEYQDTNHAQFRLRVAPRRSATGTSPSSATRTSRSTPSGAPTSETSPSSSTTSPARASSRSSRTTARRRRSSTPRTRSSTATPNRGRSGSGRSSAAACRCGSSRPTTSTPRPGSSPARSPRRSTRAPSAADIAVFYRMNAQSRVLEDVLVRQGVPLPRDRRPALLRAGRDQGRDRLPPGDRTTRPTRCRCGGS